MALITEADPRWVVSDLGGAGQNVNGWHWEEKDRSKWAKEQLELMCCKMEVGAGIKTGKTFDHFDGTVLLTNRKGKAGIVCNIELRLPWKADIKDGDGKSVAKGKGVVLVHEISEEALEDGLEIEVSMADGTAEMRNAVKIGALKKLSERSAEFISMVKEQLQIEISCSSGGADSAASTTSIATTAGVSSAEAKARSLARFDAERKADAERQVKREKAKQAAVVAKAAEAAATEAARGLHQQELQGTPYADCIAGAGEWAQQSVWGLSGCGLNDDDMEALCTQLTANDQVVELDLSENCLSDTAAQKLAALLGMGKSKGLMKLDLRGNASMSQHVNMFKGVAMVSANYEAVWKTPSYVMYDYCVTLTPLILQMRKGFELL